MNEASYHECPGSGIGEDTGGGDCEWEAEYSEPLLSWVLEYGKHRVFRVGVTITCSRCGLRLGGHLGTEKEVEA